MTAYVAGFLIDLDAQLVALVEKGKPEWQAGRINAIGGKVEEGESIYDAMRREFQEEAGVWIPDWHHFATIDSGGHVIFFMRSFTDTDTILSVRTMETERIFVWGLQGIHPRALPNLSWLLPLATYTHDTYDAVTAIERNESVY